MSWITPKTDWLETDRCTYTDINRIAGNVNYLLDSDTLKDDYTQDDVIALTEWEAILEALSGLAEASKYVPEDVPDASTTSLNMNVVEAMILGVKEWINLINAQSVAKIYSGDDIYLGDNNYVR